MINKKTKMLGADFTSNLELGAKIGCMQDSDNDTRKDNTSKDRFIGKEPGQSGFDARTAKPWPETNKPTTSQRDSDNDGRTDRSTKDLYFGQEPSQSGFDAKTAKTWAEHDKDNGKKKLTPMEAASQDRDKALSEQKGLEAQLKVLMVDAPSQISRVGMDVYDRKVNIIKEAIQSVHSRVDIAQKAIDALSQAEPVSEKNDIAVFSKREEDILRLASKLGIFESENQKNRNFRVEGDDVKALQKLLVKEGVKVAVDGVAKQDGETELGVMQIVRENANAIAGNYVATVKLLEEGHFKPKDSPALPKAAKEINH